MNQITISGFLGRDFEMVIDNSKNFIVAKNSLAITTKTKNKNGDEISHTDWIPIVIFGKKAETANKYLKKGDRFLGTGKIYTSTYKNDNGETNYSWQVNITNFEFIHNKHEKQEAEPNIIYKQQEALNQQEAQSITIEDENIPF